MRALLVCWLACAAVATAQGARTFKGRLAPVPIDVSMQATVAGTGAVSVSVTGSKVTVAGTFDGLRSPATIARIHKSPVRGVRGPAIVDLTATPGVSGTLTGSFAATPQQLVDLQAGRWYVQVHSEKAPDGNLWGWLTEKR